MTWLHADTFHDVVAATPLVSIDLIVEDPEGHVLLGKRHNRPAQRLWFVPGGRIHKNERLDEAFRRLTGEELGCAFERDQAHFLGVYEHLYDDSVFGDAPTTHYVVLGYRLPVEPAELSLPLEQHSEYRWWPPAEALNSARVHANTRTYLQ
ncbi:MAG: GDP-mannose mannosyl hydrolase [Pseudomonadota bacterium]